MEHEDFQAEEKKQPGKKRDYIYEIILFTLVFFFLPVFFIGEAVPADLPPYILQYLLVTVLQLAFFVFILVQKEKSAVSTFGLIDFKPVDLLYILGLALALFFLLLIFNLIISILPPAIRDFLTSGFRWQPAREVPVYYLLIFSLAIGLREEFFFRSYLLTRFTQIGLPPVLAIIASTALFSVGHIYQGIVGLAFAFSQGLLFSFFYLQRRSLPILAGAHALYNFVSLLLASYTNP